MYAPLGVREPLEQWFPTTVPRNTSVPHAGPKCSARTLPGLKCSTSQKRLGTTDLEGVHKMPNFTDIFRVGGTHIPKNIVPSKSKS